MSRPPRIQYCGAIYHVTARGNRRADIYLDDRDYQIWLAILGEAVERFNLVVYGFCLMPNHFHLLVKTPDGNLSAAMHFLNGKYAQKFNWRHGLSGHVLQGRFHSVLLERQEHLVELLRYIVLNPVRAGLANHADDWRWSSHRSLSHPARCPVWLDAAWILDQFPGNDSARRIRAYRRFVDAATPRASFVSATPPAPDYSPLPTLAEICETFRDRDSAILAAWHCGPFSKGQIARHFGLSARTIGRLIHCAAAGPPTERATSPLYRGKP